MISAELTPAKLIALREEAGWTQTTAARQFQMSRSGLAHLENGTRKPSAPMFKRIRDALGCTTADLAKEANDAR